MEIVSHPEYENLKEKLKSLIIEHNELDYHICPNLEYLYVKNFGLLEYELYKKDIELSKIKRKLQLIRIQINNDVKVDSKKINEQLDEEFSDYKKNMEKHYAELEEMINSTHTTLSKEDSKKLKKIYKKSVFALHPDLNKNMTGEKLILFTQITKAYKNGDLKTLESLYHMIPEGEAEEISDLDNLKDLISFHEKAIREIKEKYPYNKKELLSDEFRIEEYKKELKNLISQFESEIRNYEEKILDLI